MSIGLSMVSAGLDTVPGNLIMCIAYLASPAAKTSKPKPSPRSTKCTPTTTPGSAA